METELISPEELGTYFRSKLDLYKLLTVDRNLFLPSYKHCSLEFIREIFDGTKKVFLLIDHIAQALSNDEVISLVVPRFKELSVSKIWDIIKDVPEITIYFPDYKANELPERKFIIAIISTLNPTATKKIIADAREQRSVLCTNDPDNLVKITPELKHAIQSFSVQKTTRGVSNFLLKAKAKLRKVRRNEKEYTASLDKLKKIERKASNSPSVSLRRSRTRTAQIDSDDEERKEEQMQF